MITGSESIVVLRVPGLLLRVFVDCATLLLSIFHWLSARLLGVFRNRRRSFSHDTYLLTYLPTRISSTWAVTHER